LRAVDAALRCFGKGQKSDTNSNANASADTSADTDAHTDTVAPAIHSWCLRVE